LAFTLASNRQLRFNKRPNGVPKQLLIDDDQDLDEHFWSRRFEKLRWMPTR
jgi:hypothetical protein